MDMTEHVNRMLPVVADSWTQLRKSDIYRLLSQFGVEELDEASAVVLENRPDCKKQIIEDIADIRDNA